MGLEDELITELTIIAMAVYFAVLVMYATVAFTARFSGVYRGPTQFWTVSAKMKDMGVAPGHLRWAQVTLKTAAFNGIQSLRCLLQAGIYYSGACITVAFFVIFLKADTSRPRLVNMLMGCVAVCATVCFIQHMRFCYHLGFLVMFQQPKEGRDQDPPAVSASEAAPPLATGSGNRGVGILGGLSARHRFNKAVAMHLVSSDTTGNVGSGSLPSGHRDGSSDAMLRHLEAENSFDFDKHTARVAYVVQRQAFNFALGIRLMLFMLPLSLGAFGDELMIASTAALVPVLWYMDRLA